MPGIPMRTATVAVIEQQPSLEGGNSAGGGEGEVVSTISGVIVKQVIGCEKSDCVRGCVNCSINFSLPLRVRAKRTLPTRLTRRTTTTTRPA